MLTDAELATLMADAHTIAVVGMSDSPATPSYEVASYQQSQGYKVIPVNPAIGSALGRKSASSMDAIQEPVDIVNVFERHADVAELAQAAAQKGAKVLWLQPGVEAAGLTHAPVLANVTVVTDRCFRDEHRRLLSKARM